MCQSASTAQGNQGTRAYLARNLESRAQVSCEDLLLTASTSEAYSFLLLALCDPGDSLLVPEPSYPLLDHLARLASVKTVPYRIAYDGAWHIDLASLPERSELSEKRIRAVVAVSPNNPTGNLISEKELNALRGLGLPLIVDEVFRPYRLALSREDTEADPLSKAGKSPLTIILDGLSKRCCSPDLKLGWLVAQGQQKAALWTRLQWVSDTFLSVAGPVQAALPELLSQEEEIQTLVRTRLSESFHLLKECLHDSPATLLPYEGGWSAIVRLPFTRSEEEWWSALAALGVWIHPGQLYRLPFQCSLVVSLLTTSEELVPALSVLKSLLEE